MKARMEVTLDTVWTNQVQASVECEFDNPHLLTARMLSELMVHRLGLMAEEIRAANERAEPTFHQFSGTNQAQEPDRLPHETGTQRREVEEHAEMRRAREEEKPETIFAERRPAEPTA